jgi:hypothetical protein
VRLVIGKQIVDVTGSVYLDTNRNGVRDAAETGLGGVNVTLSGADLFDNIPVVVTVKTDAQGRYVIPLLPGNYTIVQSTASQAALIDGRESRGNTPVAGSDQAGNLANDRHTGVTANPLQPQVFNFGEYSVRPEYVGTTSNDSRLTAMLAPNGNLNWYLADPAWGPITEVVDINLLNNGATVELIVKHVDGRKLRTTLSATNDSRFSFIGPNTSGTMVRFNKPIEFYNFTEIP